MGKTTQKCDDCGGRGYYTKPGDRCNTCRGQGYILIKNDTVKKSSSMMAYVKLILILIALYFIWENFVKGTIQ